VLLGAYVEGAARAKPAASTSGGYCSPSAQGAAFSGVRATFAVMRFYEAVSPGPPQARMRMHAKRARPARQRRAERALSRRLLRAVKQPSQ